MYSLHKKNRLCFLYNSIVLSFIKDIFLMKIIISIQLYSKYKVHEHIIIYTITSKGGTNNKKMIFYIDYSLLQVHVY